MRVVNKQPWIWKFIQKWFPSAEWGKVTFTFMGTIYSKYEVPDYIFEHEKVHEKQMTRIWLIAFIWLILYWTIPKFRLCMEIPAYRREYEYLCSKVKDPSMRARALANLSLALSGPVYRKMITYLEAKNAICAE